jgi:hypothetical protein
MKLAKLIAKKNISRENLAFLKVKYELMHSTLVALFDDTIGRLIVLHLESISKSFEN